MAIICCLLTIDLAVAIADFAAVVDGIAAMVLVAFYVKDNGRMVMTALNTAAQLTTMTAIAATTISQRHHCQLQWPQRHCHCHQPLLQSTRTTITMMMTPTAAIAAITAATIALLSCLCQWWQ
jgi:hypothetical protein